MAAAVVQVPVAPRRRSWTGTPEIYFTKPIDNSRLVKMEDPRRTREMRQFGIALAFLFLLVMGYAFQHFKAIEYGYRIEALKSQRANLIEMNRALRLEGGDRRAAARRVSPTVPQVMPRLEAPVT